MKNLQIGINCIYEGKNATVEKIIDYKRVIIRDNDTAELFVKKIADLEFNDTPAMNATSIESINEKDWKEANRRYGIIKPLVDAERNMDLEVNKSSLVRKIAKENNVGYVTIYRWLNAYNVTGLVSALAPAKRSGGKDKSRLPEEVLQLMDNVIESYYANSQKRSKKSTAIEVIRNCKNAGLTPPHTNTIYNRIDLLNKEKILVKRLGYLDVSQKIAPTPGTYEGAKNPLDIFQIDHTILDVIVVDDENREPIGRPYITMAIDVYSRMVAGFYVSLDPPGSLGTGICISNAILPKEDICMQYQLKSEWPIWGIMQNVHLDNAKEFKGKMLQRASEEYGFVINWRPKGKARYGAHIERMLGTLSRKIHALPGTTFEDKKYRSNYNSEEKASMTLGELEQWLHIQIVDIYHNEKHSSLGTSPLNYYNEAIFGSDRRHGIGVPLMQFNADKVKLDFLPIIERTIQRTGVVIDHIRYYSDIFRSYLYENAWKQNDQIAKIKTTNNYIFKRDPRDISKIYFLDEKESRYAEIPYADMRRPPMSLWEYRAALKKAQEYFGNSPIDEDKIFEAYNRLKEIEEKAVKSKKIAKKEERKRKVDSFLSKPHKLDFIPEQPQVQPEEQNVKPQNQPAEQFIIEPFKYDDEI